MRKLGFVDVAFRSYKMHVLNKRGRIEIGVLIGFVFIVLLIIFGLWILKDKSNILSSTRDCENNGGECVKKDDCGSFPLNFECEDNKICCDEVIR
jgi:hypothetical protein